jgi:hypothetical protein
MRVFRRREFGVTANEIATQAAVQSEGSRTATIVTAVVSVIALIFSAYSLWETALKQAELSVYATGVVTYERDGTADTAIQPAGGFEVFVIPVTISNGGARDAAVLAMQLDVKNPGTGLTARFEATYTADATYFANTGAKRPKTPFSALVLAGRSAWTGTVIFYPVSYSNGKALTPVRQVAAFYNALRKKYANEMGGASSISVLREKLPNLPEFAEADAFEAKVLNQNEKVEVTLRLVTPPPGGWLDRVLGVQVSPITLNLAMPDIPGDRVSHGELVRLRSGAAGL